MVIFCILHIKAAILDFKMAAMAKLRSAVMGLENKRIVQVVTEVPKMTSLYIKYYDFRSKSKTPCGSCPRGPF